MSDRTKSLSSLLAQECAQLVDVEKASAALSAVNHIFKVLLCILCFVNNLSKGESLGAALAVTSGAAVISAAATQACHLETKAAGEVLDDYLSLRLLALEEKVMRCAPLIARALPWLTYTIYL